METNDDSSKSVNRIHYAKTMSNLKELQWEQWIEKHKNSKVNEIYQSFDSIIQENILRCIVSNYFEISGTVFQKYFYSFLGGKVV